MKYILSIILLVILITFIILLNNKEFFKVSPIKKGIGICNFKPIYTKQLENSPLDKKKEIYNNKFGPTCIAECIKYFGQNIQFTNPDNTSDILNWNNKNPTKGFCYRANDDKYPFLCEGEDTTSSNKNKKLNCKEICGKDLNENYEHNRFYKYNPDIDFSNCRKDTKLGCVEKTLNICSGNAYEKYIGCKECIKEYMPNIEKLNDLRDTQFAKENEKCP